MGDRRPQGISDRDAVAAGTQVVGRCSCLHGVGVPRKGVRRNTPARNGRGRSGGTACAVHVLHVAERNHQVVGVGYNGVHRVHATASVRNPQAVGAGQQVGGRWVGLHRGGFPRVGVGQVSARYQGLYGSVVVAHTGGVGCRCRNVQCRRRARNGNLGGGAVVVGVQYRHLVGARSQLARGGRSLDRHRVPKVAVRHDASTHLNTGASGCGLVANHGLVLDDLRLKCGGLR